MTGGTLYKSVQWKVKRQLTDARRDGQFALLISGAAAIARQTGNSFLARTLPRRLVARSAERTNRVTLARCRHNQSTSSQTPHHIEQQISMNPFNTSNTKVINDVNSSSVSITPSVTLIRRINNKAIVDIRLRPRCAISASRPITDSPNACH